VQRFAYLNAPTRETVHALLALRAHADASGDEALAGALDHTLGSVTGALARAGDARVHELHGLLRGRLAAASTIRAKRAALAALGNAGLDSDREIIAAYAGDPSEQVRSQVAWSLRKLDSKESRATLVALVGDPHLAVQTAALQTLTGMRLGASDRERLAALVAAGRVQALAYRPLATLLSREPLADAHAGRALELLVARDDADAETRAFVERELRRRRGET
jgi:HEAT repeat protein